MANNTSIEKFTGLTSQIYPASQSGKLKTGDEFEFFPEEYFSSSNISIYFENILIDEITRLSFALQEQVMPIYGYNDYVPKVYARGNRIIQGQFGINFKEAYYLRRAISLANSNRTSSGSLLKNERRNLEKIEEENFLGRIKNTVKREIQFGQVEEKDRQKRIDELTKISPSAFELVSTAFELALWGNPGNAGLSILTADTGLSKVIAGVNNSSKLPYFKQSIPDDKGNIISGLFITIEYGEVKRFTRSSGDELKISTIENGRTVTNTVANKEVIRNRNLDEVEYVPGTIKTLSNVQITGVSQQMDLDGAPIQEIYNFIASDLDCSPKGR